MLLVHEPVPRRAVGFGGRICVEQSAPAGAVWVQCCLRGAVWLPPNCSHCTDLLWAALAQGPVSSLLSGITHMFWICPVTISDQSYSSQLQYPYLLYS